MTIWPTVYLSIDLSTISLASETGVVGKIVQVAAKFLLSRFTENVLSTNQIAQKSHDLLSWNYFETLIMQVYRFATRFITSCTTILNGSLPT